MYNAQLTDFQKKFFFDESDFNRSCVDKIGYSSKWQAQYAIDESQQYGAPELSYYLCKYCGKYHLTSKI